MLSRLLRIWGIRLLLSLGATVFAVLILHLPKGYPPRMVGGPSMAAPWAWEVYLGSLQAFLAEVRQGEILFYSTPQVKLPFNQILRNSWKNSLWLFSMATVIGVSLGVMLGALVALRRRLPSMLSATVSTLGLALPDFTIVLLGQWLLIWTFVTYDVRLWTVLADMSSLSGRSLGLVALTMAPLAYMTRLTAAAMDEVMDADYIRTARSKGVPEWRVIFGHAFRNVMNRLLSGLPTLMSMVLSSMVVVERLTVWPGIVRWLSSSNTQTVMPDGSLLQTGTTVTMVAIAGVLLIAWFVVMDGLAHSLKALNTR